MELVAKQHKGTFWSDENVLYNDYGGNYTTYVQINYSLKIYELYSIIFSNFIQYKAFPRKREEFLEDYFNTMAMLSSRFYLFKKPTEC